MVSLRISLGTNNEGLDYSDGNGNGRQILDTNFVIQRANVIVSGRVSGSWTAFFYSSNIFSL